MLQPKNLWPLVIILLLAIGACKEPEGIGLDVLPNGEEMPIAWIDSFTIKARTVRFDSVRTSGRGTSVIGDFGDPIFGRVKSQLYTQFKLNSEPGPDNFADATIDSVVLNLAYSGGYGRVDKLRGTQWFGVYEIEEDLEEDSVYYSDDTLSNISASPLAEVTFRPNLLNGYTIFQVNDDDEDIPPSFRVRLDDAFGQRILDSDSLTTNDMFSGDFKGLNIRSDAAFVAPDFGALLYFDLPSSNSRLELYYHTATEDSIRYYFDMDNNNAAFTNVYHEFTQELLDAMDTTMTIGDQKLYIQSLAGTRIRVEFPYLKNLNNLGAVAINKAELVLPVDENSQDDFPLPQILIASKINVSDSAFSIVDQYELDGINYYGGIYNSEDNEYVFNISRHLQSVINDPDETDYGLYISSVDAVDSRRGVFNGPLAPSGDSLKLRMTFTIIE